MVVYVIGALPCSLRLPLDIVAGCEKKVSCTDFFFKRKKEERKDFHISVPCRACFLESTHFAACVFPGGEDVITSPTVWYADRQCTIVSQMGACDSDHKTKISTLLPRPHTTILALHHHDDMIPGIGWTPRQRACCVREANSL